MSTDMAHRIGKLFGNGPTLWVNMQKAIDLWDAEREHSTDYKKIQTLEIACLPRTVGRVFGPSRRDSADRERPPQRGTGGV